MDGMAGSRGACTPSDALSAWGTRHDPGIQDKAAAVSRISPSPIRRRRTPHSLVSKLRRWLGTDQQGRPYLPVYSAEAGYRLDPRVTTDWHAWQMLLPDGVGEAPTGDLAAALRLVRGRPFDGARARRYGWAEYSQQRMISEIVDAAAELARRHLVEARWREAEKTVVLGLTVEPGIERLWRLRILAAHGSGNRVATKEAVDRMLAITDDLGGDLEPETEQLLADLDEALPRERLLRVAR